MLIGYLRDKILLEQSNWKMCCVQFVLFCCLRIARCCKLYSVRNNLAGSDRSENCHPAEAFIQFVQIIGITLLQ